MPTLQRLAGNAAVVSALQRDAPIATTSLHAEIARATSKDGTAAVIWRSDDGVIAAVIEFESNATLNSYLTGTTTLEALLAKNRAIVAQQSVSTKSLPAPSGSAGTPTQAPVGAPGIREHPKTGQKPHTPSTLAHIAETAYKWLRTARTLVFIATQRAVDDAQRVISATSAELKILKRQAAALTNRMTKSGGGAKVSAKLAEVRAEIARVETALAEQRSALRAAQATVKAEQAAAAGLLARLKQLMGHEGVARKPSFIIRTIGKYIAPQINKVVRLLEASNSGIKVLAVLRKLQSPWVGRILIGAAAVFEGVNAYLTTKNRTRAGKIADATISAGTGALVVANPVTAIADVVLPEKYKLSKMYRGGSGAVTAIGEGILTGDTSAMESFHEASKKGEYGKVMQLSSEAGDYWAEHGVIGGLKDFGREFWDWL